METQISLDYLSLVFSFFLLFFIYCFDIVLEIDSYGYLDNKEHYYLNHTFFNRNLLKKSEFHAESNKFKICFYLNSSIFNHR